MMNNVFTKRSALPAQEKTEVYETEERPAAPSLISLPPIDRDRIGRYEIIYPISQGGMAGVYVGRLKGIAGFQRLVAVKVIHSHLSTEETFVRMFLDEARLAAGIHHPNVGEVIEVGEDDGLYYMVCELILGQSLSVFQRRAVRENIPVPKVLYAQIASTTCLALTAAHNLTDTAGRPLNLVHRDVTPHNILLTYDGYVKLIDFGVAYAQGRISQTEAGVIKGKLGYMSPEQLKCRPLDRRSDIFSLGVVLYEMVTGRPPFYGETDIERFNKILDFRFDRPRQIVRSIPPRLEKIILQAMAYSPDDRYPTTAAMGEDLEAFIRQAKESAAPDELSRMMHAMFSKERDHHTQKMRAFGKSEVFADRLSIDDATVNLRATACDRAAPDTTDAVPTDPGSIASERLPESTLEVNRTGDEQVRKGRDKSGRLYAKVGILVAAAIGLFWMGSILLSEKRTEIPQTRIHHDGNTTQNEISSPNSTKIEKSEKGDTRSADTASTTQSEVKITLLLSPPDAQLELDSVAMSPNTTSLQLSGDSRVHHLRISKEGYAEQTAAVRADVDKILSISLVPQTYRSPIVDSSEKIEKNAEKRTEKSLTGTDGTAQLPKQSVSRKETAVKKEAAAPTKTAATEKTDALSEIVEPLDTHDSATEKSSLLEKSPYQ